MVGNGLHARCWDCRVAVGEHAEDDVEHAAAVVQVRIELDAANQRAEEPLDDLVAETGLAECITGADVVATEQLCRVDAADSATEQSNAGLVEQRTNRRGDRAQHGGGHPERVGHDRPLAVPPDQCTRVERLQVEGIHVELPLHLGIGGQGDLESAVEDEAVDDVGPDASTNAIAGLVDVDLDARLVERCRARQASEASADDCDGHLPKMARSAGSSSA